MKKSNYKDIANEYDILRPDYPTGLFDTLENEARLESNSLLLEVGAGTGKATMGFVNKGYTIDCIEVEAAMAELLKEKTKDYNVNVSVNSFEKWENESSIKYDLVYSAQAFHWIDKDIKYKKCYDLLNKTGKIGLFWYVSVFESDKMFDEISNIFKKYNTGFSSTKMELLKSCFNRERKELEDTKYFENLREYTFMSKTIEQDADVFIERYNTTSAYETLCDETKKRVNDELRETIDRLGGTVKTVICYNLFIADKSITKQF